MAEFIIKSDTRTTISHIAALYDYLTDFKNFGNILPEDKVENFSYDGDKCTFTIRGITALSVRIAEKTPYSKILFVSEGLAKFNFRLQANFIGADPNEPGNCNIELYADMNPFIKAMAEKPLMHLVNAMAVKLSELNLKAS